MNLTPSCSQGNGVVDGTVEFNTPGQYFIRTWCIDNTDTLERDSFYVNVHALPVVIIGPLPALCQDDSPLDLTAYINPGGGILIGLEPELMDALTGGTLNPGMLPTGSYTILYRYVSPTTGCQNMDTATIKIRPCNPGQKFDTTCVDDTIDFSAYCKKGNSVTQGTVNYGVPGNYKIAHWCVDGDDTLTYDSVYIHVKQCPSGIGHVSSPSFTIYPNPARDYIMLEGDISRIDRITVINALGEEKEVARNGQRIDLESVAPGVFFIRIQFGDKVSVLKGIKLP